MAKITVKQIRSVIGQPKAQRNIVKALGLGRINKTKELNDTPAVRGMVASVPHMVKIVEK